MNNHISARWDLRGDCGEDSEANTHSGEEREKPQLFFILCFSFFFFFGFVLFSLFGQLCSRWNQLRLMVIKVRLALVQRAFLVVRGL